MIKNIKTKVIISIIILFTMMATFLSYNSYALTETHLENGDLVISGENQTETITYNDYKTKWYVLCCEKGMTLRSFGGNYAKEGNYIATPSQAYILNNSKEEFDNAVNYNPDTSKTQFAWWSTSAVVKGSDSVAANQLYTTAVAYQNFVKMISKSPENIEKTETYETRTHTFEDGNTVSIQFPELDETKLDNSFNFESSNITVNYDTATQQYIVGPFKLSYEQGGANGVDFGSINGFDIYTDASTEPLSKDQWSLVLSEYDTKNNAQYPSSNQNFYIRMNYIENVTKITGIDVDYKYLIAGGQYQRVVGSYYENRNKSTGNSEFTATYNSKYKNHKSQTLGIIQNAARWYETTRIHIDTNQSQLVVEKKAVDEQGNELSSEQIKKMFGKDQYFDFKVKVTYSDGRTENSTVTVKAGSKKVVGNYVWAKGENAPTYEVEEISMDSNLNWKVKEISNSKGSLSEKQAISVVAVNTAVKNKHNDIEITKTISGIADSDEQFKFQVIVTMPDGSKDEQIAEITVPEGKQSGNVWSHEYWWYGTGTPTYEIKEIETEASKKYTPNITPSKGYLDGTGAKVEVLALNNEIKDDKHHGYLTIEKELTENQVTSDLFKFYVEIDGVTNTENGKMNFEVNLKAGEKYESCELFWEGDEAPTFKVTENNSNMTKGVNIEVTGGTEVQKSGSTVTGKIVAATDNNKNATNVNVKFVNDIVERHASIKVKKDFFSTEKLSSDELKKLASDKSFTVNVVVEGTFRYGNEFIQNGSKVITGTLSANNDWSLTTDEIKWYNSVAPTYYVEEVNVPKPWKFRSIEYKTEENSSTDSVGRYLVDNNVAEVKIVNEIPSGIEIDLTFAMAGVTWIDDILESKNDVNGNGYRTTPNGVYDDSEQAKEGVEVTVYKVIYDNNGNVVSRNIAKAYSDEQNNEVSFPIVTKEDGKWNVARMPVPALTQEQLAQGYKADYDVEFKYDGQTYEPTEFLSYKVANKEKSGYDKENEYYVQKNAGSVEERANEYKNTSNGLKYEYYKDSMAIEQSNNSKNIVEVLGKSEMNSNGDTTGIVKLADGTTAEVTYSSDNAGMGYPVQSKLNTTDANGNVLDIFKATATTSLGSLTYPFNIQGYNGISLSNSNGEVEITEAVVNNIAENADKTGLTDVSSTLDETKGIVTKYKYIAVYNHCLNINLGLKARESLDIGLSKKLDNAKVVVKEKLYQYNYSGKFDLTEEKTNTLDKNIYVENGSEKVEFTLGLYKSDYYYRAELYNASEDKSLYEVLTNFYTTINKKLNDSEMDIYLTYKIRLQNSSSSYNVTINSLDDYYDSNYTLVTADESKYLKTQTVKGQETNVDAIVTVANASQYSDKWNTVSTNIEGSDGVTYNKMIANGLGITLAPNESKDVVVTFKVNKETNTEGVKDAIVLGQKCNVAEISSYSSDYGKIDRDSAPANLNIRTHNDKSWYEDDTFAAPALKIDFVTDEKSRDMSGIAWEDNSKDTNTENPGYNQQVGNGIKDNNENGINGLDAELVEKIIIPTDEANNVYTQYDFIWPTDKKLDVLGGKSLNELTGLDTTIMTNANGEYTFTNIPAGDYVVKFIYGNKAIESNNYSTATYYNGQDYKSTTFKGTLNKIFDDKYIVADSYLDINSTINSEQHKNVGLDNEVRRIQVVSNSRELTNKNVSTMTNYDEESELYNSYYMFAETPKLDINVELSSYGSNEYSYKIGNIDFGLEERPITNLTLDKQIEEIILKTSDGKVIMNAKYNIDYTVDENGSIKANVTLDKEKSVGIDNLQALNRDQATNQGFRYINVDSTILEGTTITAKYRITALNTGEVDRTGELSKYDIDLDEIVGKLSTEFATFKKDANGNLVNDTKLGKYVGSIYYLGANGNSNDAIVTTTARQIVDYVDNDATFEQALNVSPNMSWKPMSIDELKDNVSDSVFTTLNDGTITVVDSNNVQYQTENRNNIVVNVDSIDEESDANNAGFIVELKPYAADNNNYKSSMNITVTRYVGADSDDLQIDNIAELLKYNNTVGRRDELSIVGNQNPAIALESNPSIVSTETLSDTMVYERDTSATEVITLSPPTGSGLTIWKLQVVGTITIALVIIAGGIIIIKKKVLK